MAKKLELVDYEKLLKIVTGSASSKTEQTLIDKLKNKIHQLKNPKKRIVEYMKYQCGDCHKEFKRSLFKCKDCGNSDIKQMKMLEFS